jgi:transposase
MVAGKWWVGIDWGAEFHQVCVLDSEGKCLGQRKFSHTSTGLAEMLTWLASHAAGSPRLVQVAIERPHGAVVELLLQRDFAVYSINPKQLDRFRDRHTVAGAKDDRRDALVLADSLRTDAGAFSPLQVDDPTVVEIRELIRVDEDLRAEENGLQNRLREQLLRYFPAMLLLIAHRADPFLWSLLERATTHDEASRLPPQIIALLLKEHRVRRLTVEQVQAVLQSPTLKVSEATVSAATAHIQLLIPRLRLVHQQRGKCGKNIEKLLARLTASDQQPAAAENCQHRDATILQSLPGVGKIVLATVLVEAAAPIARRDLHGLRALGGIAPVTRRSGKQDQKLMRRACNARLRYAFYHWGRTAMQRDPLTKEHYAILRKKGHSHGRALRGVVDRLLSVAIAMLKQGSLYDPARRQRHACVVTTTA